MWYAPIAALTVLIVGIIVTYLTGPRQQNEIDPKLIISIGDVCCCCLPKSVRDFLRCGIDYDKYSDEMVCIY